MHGDDHPDRIPEDRCAGCGAPLGGFYCSECGQHRARRITFRRVFSDAIEHLLTLDSTFLRTVVGLTKHPGRVCREYVLGRRKTYVNPIKYTFVIVTVVLLVGGFFLFLSPDVLDVGEDDRRARRAIAPLLAYLGYVVMLPVAAVQRLLFRRQPFGVAECYVVLLFAYAQVLLLGILLFLSFGLLIPFRFVLQPLAWLASLAYFIWAMAGFYRSWKPLTYLKATVVVAALAVGFGSIFLAIQAFLAMG